MRALATIVSAVIAVMASAGAVLAQAPPAARVNAPFPPWQTEKVTDDLYVIFGEGGNTTVLLTDEGVVLVDVKFERGYDEIQSRVKALTDQPVKYVFNTHSHQDHTGGNTRFLPSATVIAHANARAQIVESKLGVPQVSFTDAITVTLGGKTAVGRYFGRAHTNGDTWVYFPAQKVLATGDSFNNGRGTGGTGGFFGLYIAPTGSFVDITKTLDEVLKLDFERVVPGHGPLSTRADVVKWRAEIETVRNRVRGMVREGKSREDVAKMLTAEFRWDPTSIIMRSVDDLMTQVR